MPEPSVQAMVGDDEAVVAALRAAFPDSAPEEDGGDAGAVWLDGDSLAPFRVTPLVHVLSALRLAAVAASDTVLDVGCGDGRVLVAAAALRGAAAHGLELEPRVAALARAAVARWEAAAPPAARPRVSVACGDATAPGALLLAPTAPATVIFCSLLADGVAALEPALCEALDAAPAGRLVTLYFPLRSREPAGADAGHRLWLYRSSGCGGGDTAA